MNTELPNGMVGFFARDPEEMGSSRMNFITEFATMEPSNDEKYGLLLTIDGVVWGQFNMEEHSAEAIALRHNEEIGPAQIISVIYEGKERTAIITTETDLVDGCLALKPIGAFEP